LLAVLHLAIELLYDVLNIAARDGRDGFSLERGHHMGPSYKH
jgi:hypothetical protein